MTTRQITIDLPEPVYRALVGMAEVTDQPLELLVTQLDFIHSMSRKGSTIRTRILNEF